ncbi:MAG: hypothetical protein KAS30_01715 [Candidatus Diapherotrites archaeon]|nr:hypothetical protein [Candidatus Diapherotrites archaeon]
MDKKERKALRVLLSNYFSSEGCSCCRGGDHDKNQEAICKLLNFPKYSDDSGYQIYKYKTGSDE